MVFMKILLDTSFILSAVKQKIDFFDFGSEVFDKFLVWIVPYEVLDELKNLSIRKGGRVIDKNSSLIALEIIQNHNVKKVKLKNKNVDSGIVEYAKKHEKQGIIVATLDKEMKSKINGKTLSIRGKKDLIIV